MNHSKRMVRVKGPEKDRPLIVAADLETAGFTGKVLYMSWWIEGNEHAEGTTNLPLFVHNLLELGMQKYTIYFHNAQFDLRYLLPEIIKQTDGKRIDPIVQGNSRIIGLKIKMGRKVIKILDSFAVFSVSLSKFSKTFSPDNAKLTGVIDFEKEQFNPDNPVHVEYALQDAKALGLSIINADKVLFDTFEVHLRPSAAGTAMAAYRRMIPHDLVLWRKRPGVDDFCRESFRGGRVYLKDDIEHYDCLSVDVNAMYAFAMSKGVPYGMGTHTTTFMVGLPGFYRVIASCPNNLAIPLLSVKVKGKLVYFTDTQEVIITSIELEKAIILGYSIEIIEGIYFDQIIKPFTAFLEHCQTLELENKGNPIGDTCKLMRNSLYGKWGLKPIQNHFVIATECPEGYAPVIDESSRTISIIENVWFKEEIAEADYMHPEIASWITANARLVWYELAEQIGLDDVLYGDTDSLTAPRVAIESAGLSIGKVYGQVKIDKTYKTFRAIAPKVYIGIDDKGADVIRAKGIPSKLATREVLENPTVPVYWESPTSMLSMLKGKQTEYSITRERRIRAVTKTPLVDQSTLTDEEWLAQYENYPLFADSNKFQRSELFRIIVRELGGIRPAEDCKEEYKDIPVYLRRKKGLTPDEIADKLASSYPYLGILTENDLYRKLGEY